MRTKLILFLLLLVSCARPKYEVAAPKSFNQTISPAAAQTERGCAVPVRPEGCLNWHWITPPSRHAFATMLIRYGRPNLADESFVALEGPALPSAYLFMPAHGHGSAKTPVIERLDVGTYRVSNLFFSMEGTWDVHVQFKRDGQVIGDAVVPIDYRF